VRSDSLDKEEIEIMRAFLVSFCHCLIMNPWPDLQTSEHIVVHVNILLVLELHIVNINLSSLILAEIRLAISSDPTRYLHLGWNICCCWVNIRSRQLIQVINQLAKWYA
jgi:hypothetical protein